MKPKASLSCSRTFTRMKKFKIKKGIAKIYDISEEEYEKAVKGRDGYIETTKDGIKRYFALCPYCENPIQLIGLYKKIETDGRKISPYGKHYNKDTKISKHYEYLYKRCPYAANVYVSENPKLLSDTVTDYERNIYNAVRDNLDLAIYILKQDTGIFFTNEMIKDILREYIASRGYMYYRATIYNIPWMLLYFWNSRKCYGLLVKKDKSMYDMLSQIDGVQFEQYGGSDYYIVRNSGKYLKEEFVTLFHKRAVTQSDELDENVTLMLTSADANGEFHTDGEVKLVINEHRFPNLVVSENAKKYRNQEILDIAKMMMPEV